MLKKTNTNIQIVISTLDNIHSLSLKSAQSVLNALESRFEAVSISVINSLEDLENVVREDPDLVFIGMKQLPIRNGTNISIPGYLEDRGIAVTGSGSDALELERNKTDAKDIIRSAGLATPSYVSADLSKIYEATVSSLSFPVFIKPTNRGAGIGIDENSVVRNQGEFISTINTLTSRGFTSVMTEDYLSGSEYSVSVLGEVDSADYTVMPLEIVAPKNIHGDRILGSDIKDNDTEKSMVVPAGELRNKILAFAEASFVALGGRDYGRIDMRLNNTGELQFIEANLLPSLSNGPGNYFPKACLLGEGLEYNSIIIRIANLALSRSSNTPDIHAGIALIPAIA